MNRTCLWKINSLSVPISLLLFSFSLSLILCPLFLSPTQFLPFPSLCRSFPPNFSISLIHSGIVSCTQAHNYRSPAKVVCDALIVGDKTLSYFTPSSSLSLSSLFKGNLKVSYGTICPTLYCFEQCKWPQSLQNILCILRFCHIEHTFVVSHIDNFPLWAI